MLFRQQFGKPNPKNWRDNSLKMPGNLSARAIHRIETAEGIAAEVIVTEPNGDEYIVRCLCRMEGLTVDGEGDALSYLNERYGDVAFSTTVRDAALGHG